MISKLLAASAALATCLAVGLGLIGESPPPADNFVDVEVATVGFDHLSLSPIVLLRDRESGRAVPIWIGMTEAQAILQKLQGVEPPRPLTHDLAITLLTEAGARIEEVVVHDMRDGVYYGAIKLRIAKNDALVEIDSRPSDALALALRADARIRVAEKILTLTPDFQFVPPDAAQQVARALGVTVVALSDDVRGKIGEDAQGVLVSSVSSTAEAQGIETGDVILRVNDQAVTTPIDFLERILDIPAGRNVRLKFWRAGETKEIELQIEPREERTIQI